MNKLIWIILTATILLAGCTNEAPVDPIQIHTPTGTSTCTSTPTRTPTSTATPIPLPPSALPPLTPTATATPTAIPKALPEYKFTEYIEYAQYIAPRLSKVVGVNLQPAHVSGGAEGREFMRGNGRVCFIMIHMGEWNTIRHWAVEVNASTGDLIRYEEVTAEENQVNYTKIWWA